jgi:glycosyltransferase involved in cell wall biosynthesis
VQPSVNSSLRPLKLALVTRRYPPSIGGAEKVLSYLANALAALEAEVTVVTSQVPEPKPAAKTQAPLEISGPIMGEEELGCAQLKIVRLKTSRLRFWGTWRYMRNLKRWFRSNPVDLAYVSMLKHDAYVVVRAGEELGFPVILRPEGAGATGDIAWQSWGNFGRLIGLRCRRATAFITISAAVEQELEQAWQTGTMRRSWLRKESYDSAVSPRIVTIPNGVPVSSHVWSIRSDWQKSPRAVFLGRLAIEKGLDSLIEAWPLVRQNYPNSRLILIGDGPERANLETSARRLGLKLGPGQDVEFRGTLCDATRALEEADLFVLPSREEGMSIALLEAMALGMPLVASAIPGNRQLVADKVEGRLAPLDDPESLARAIVEQWGNFDRAVEMGRAARSRVEREFSIQAVARKHLALFQEILRERELHAGARSRKIKPQSAQNHYG